MVVDIDALKKDLELVFNKHNVGLDCCQDFARIYEVNRNVNVYIYATKRPGEWAIEAD